MVHLTDTAFFQDPYLYFDILRAHRTPVFMDSLNLWFIGDYPNVVKALQNERLSSAVPSPLMSLPSEMVEQLVIMHEQIQTLTNTPDNRRLRETFHKALTPALLKHVQERTSQHVENLMKPLRERPLFDFVEALAVPLPFMLIADILGLENTAEFRQWTRDLLEANDLIVPPDAGQNANAAATALMEVLSNAADSRQRAPQTDLLSLLLQTDLNLNEVVALCILMVITTVDTLTNLLSNTALALMTDPDQFNALKQDNNLVPLAIEESLRYESPLHLVTRLATETVTFGEVVISAGAVVGLGLSAANRDPEIFANPGTFDINRQGPDHVAFGNGVHACLGAPLARMQAHLTVEGILRHLPTIQLAIDRDRLQYKPSLRTRGLISLPVRGGII
jgi:cytochrome P450